MKKTLHYWAAVSLLFVGHALFAGRDDCRKIPQAAATNPIPLEELLTPNAPSDSRPMPAEVRDRHFPTGLTNRLADHALTSIHERTPEGTEFWIKYKNEADATNAVHSEARTFDLGKGTVAFNGSEYGLAVPPGARHELSRYELMLLHARKGDTIVFPNGRSFELGDFLGMGNSTHIFTLRKNGKDTGQALRIPLYAEAEVEGVPDTMVQRLRLGETMLYAKRYAEPPEALNLVNRVKVVETGTFPMKGQTGTVDFFAYFAVPRLNIGETGKSFLKRVEGDGYRETPEEEMKYRTLKEDLATLEKAGAKQVPEQFAWDLTSRRWILLDWE